MTTYEASSLSQEIYHSPDNEVRVIATNDLASFDRDAVWGMVEQGFASLNKRAGTKQDMTRKEYDEDMNAQDVYHYVAYDTANRPIGFLNLHWGVEGVTWAPSELKDRMNKMQQALNPAAKPAYVGTLVVPEELRAGEVVSALIHGCYAHWQGELMERNGEFLCFFDCAEANYPRLPNLLKWLSRSSMKEGTHLEMKEIAVVPDPIPDGLQLGNTMNWQHYCAMQIVPNDV